MSNEPPQSLHHASVEVFGVAPKLRDDLEIRVQVFAGKPCYVIEDPIRSRFCRVGVAEYTLMSLLDGRKTLAEALGESASVSGAEALNEQEAASFCKWLIDSHLATTPQSSSSERLLVSTQHDANRRRAERANPMVQKLPLFCPEPLLRCVVPLTRGLFDWWAVLVWFAVVLLGAYAVWSNAGRFLTGSDTIFSPHNWGWLIVTGLALKLVHETGHALACKRFGGTVREAGVLFVLLAPMPYVDVTSSWRFDTKWKRALTAVAGVYVELFVAGIAALVWAWSDNGLLAFHARNTVVTAGLTTVLFNANPLMRFDGYYLLTDLIEMPNLATHGRQQIGYWLKRWFLGATGRQPDCPEGRTALVVAYGVAAMLWRGFISLVLVIAAESLLYGAGVVLSAVAVVLLVGTPVWRLVKLLWAGEGVNRWHTANTFGVGAAALSLLWFVLPWQPTVLVPAIIEYDPLTELRTPVAGFVRQVLVRPGDTVAEGDLLVELENDELNARVEQLRLDIERSRQRARQFRHAAEIAALQVENESRQTLETRLDDLEHRQRHLRLCAPHAGIVVESTLHDRVGTLLKSGELTLRLGDVDTLRVYALAPQHQADGLGIADESQVDFNLDGGWGRSFTGAVVRSQPRATSRVMHQALIAPNGGPLAVRALSSLESQQGERWELLEPHVAVVIRLSDNERSLVRAGQTGWVRFQQPSEPVGQIVRRRIDKWISANRSQSVF